MLFAIVEWWVGLSRTKRYLFSLAWLLTAVATYVAGGRIWPGGLAIGGALLLCTFLGIGENPE